MSLPQYPLWMHGLQFIVLAQPFIWTKLYKKNIDLDSYATWFHGISIMTIPLIYFTGFEFGYYRSHLLIQYVILVNIAIYLYHRRYRFKDALCLGFLTVFLNSYYWEVILHLIEYLTVGYYHPAQIVQLWRLTPAYWFHRNYSFTDRQKIMILLVGPLFSLAIYLMKQTNKGNIYLLPLNRLVCLLILVYSISNAKNQLEGLLESFN